MPLRRLSLHGLALAATLATLYLLVGPTAQFSSDEGAAVLQARAVQDGGWFLDHPFPEVDPDGRWFPLEKSAARPDGFAPLPKQLLYPWLLAPAGDAFGLHGMVGLSLIGVVVAALAAGVLAESIRSGTGPAALWVTGALSPLVVDGALVYAHTLAAACVGLSAVGLLAVLRAPPSPRLRWIAAGSAAVLVGGVAVLLRAEAALALAALGLAGVGLALWRRSVALAFTGAALAVVAVAARELDQRITSSVIGVGRGVASVAPAAAADDAPGFLSDRWSGLVTTMLRPAYQGGILPMLSVAVVVLGGYGVIVLRRRDHDVALVRFVWGAVAVAAVARFAFLDGDPAVIPGLLVAFPLVVWGALSLRRSVFDEPAVVLLAAASVLFAGAVVATQYRQGGSYEWGGRYFAVGLPLACPLVVLALRGRLGQARPEVWRPVLVGLVVASASTAVIGLGAVRSTGEQGATLVDRVTSLAAGTEPGDGRSPVIVSTEAELPRAAWDSFDDFRWLFVPPARLGPALDALEEVGIEEAVIATRRSARVAGLVSESGFGHAGAVPERAGDLWWFTVIRR